MITILAILASLFTGQTCAAINNTSNTAVWVSPGQINHTTYKDDGERLVYLNAPGKLDNSGWLALHNTEVKLLQGPSGPKIRVACSASPRG